MAGFVKKFWFLATPILALVLTGAFFLERSGTGTPSAPESLDPALQQAVDVRAEMGLSTDVDWVRQVESDPTASRVWRGIALTDAELASWTARVGALSKAAQSVIPLVEGEPGFAGVYLRYAPEDAIVVVDAGSNGHLASVVRSVSAAKVVIQPGEFTLTELRALQETVAADIPDWNGRGIRIATAGINIVKNRVELGVVEPTPSGVAVLLLTYGPRISVAPMTGYPTTLVSSLN
jgi:hypothetical protein